MVINDQNLETVPLNNIGFVHSAHCSCPKFVPVPSEKCMCFSTRENQMNLNNSVCYVHNAKFRLNHRIDDSIQNVKAVTNAVFSGPFSAFNSSERINQSVSKICLACFV